MNLRKISGLILMTLLASSGAAQTIGLDPFLELIKKNHPYFAKEALSVEIEEKHQERFLGAEDLIISASPYYLHQKPLSSSAFASERIDMLSLSAGVERAFWNTGGRLSLSWSSDFLNQTVPEITFPGFSMPLGFEHFYQHRIYAIYSQPLLQNFLGRLDRLEYDLSQYTTDFTAIQAQENQELFLLGVGGRFLDWVLLGEQESIANERQTFPAGSHCS